MYSIFVIEGKNKDLENEITKLLAIAHEEGKIKNWSERFFEPIKSLEDFIAGLSQGINIAYSSRTK